MLGVSRGPAIAGGPCLPKNCIRQTPKDKITDEFVEEALTSLGGTLVKGEPRGYIFVHIYIYMYIYICTIYRCLVDRKELACLDGLHLKNKDGS